jgi:ribosomal protein L18
MQYKLAELLLRRKELNEKTRQLERIKTEALFETKAKRVNVTESLDDIVAQVPKLTASQVTAEYDFYARQLRIVDSHIQQANWQTEVTVESDDVMAPYRA